MDQRDDDINDSGCADLNNNSLYDSGQCRMCPARLTKRELEDLYFTVIEANIKLNNIIKEKDEQIKMLTSVCEQYSAKKQVGKKKDSGTNTHTTQRYSRNTIGELRRVNEKMTERIRVLNLKLASMSKEPVRTQSRMVRDSNGRKTSPKANRPTVEVIKKTLTNGTQTEIACDVDRICRENKCQTHVEELREKIEILEAELALTHHEYSMRIGRLELEVQQRPEGGQGKDNVSEVKNLQERHEKPNALVERSQDIGELNSKDSSKVANVAVMTPAEMETRDKHTCATQWPDSKDMMNTCKACQCNRSIEISDDKKENTRRDTTGVIDGHERVAQDSLYCHMNDNKAYSSFDTQRNKDESDKQSEGVLASLDTYDDACSNPNDRDGKKRMIKQESVEAQRHDHVSDDKKEGVLDKSLCCGTQKPADLSYNKSAKGGQELLNTCLAENEFSCPRCNFPIEAFDYSKCNGKKDNVVYEKDIDKGEIDAQARHESDDEVQKCDGEQYAFTICVKCNRKSKYLPGFFTEPGHKDTDQDRETRIITSQPDNDRHENMHGNKNYSPDSRNFNRLQESEDLKESHVAPESSDAKRHEASCVKKDALENKGDKHAPDVHKCQKCVPCVNHDIDSLKVTPENKFPETLTLTHEDGTHAKMNGDTNNIIIKNSNENLPVNNVPKGKSRKYKACKCECYKYVKKAKKKSNKKTECECQKYQIKHTDINTPSSKMFNSSDSERVGEFNEMNEVFYEPEKNVGSEKTEHGNRESPDGDCTTTIQTLCTDKLANNSEITTNKVQEKGAIVCQQCKRNFKKKKDSEDTIKQTKVRTCDTIENDLEVNPSELSNTIKDFDTFRFVADSKKRHSFLDSDVCSLRNSKSCTNARMANKTKRETDYEIQDCPDTIKNKRDQSVTETHLEISEPLTLADKSEPVSKCVKKESNQDTPTIIIPTDSFMDPDTLVKSLEHINEEQMKTINELEHQLHAEATSSRQTKLEEAEDKHIDDYKNKHPLYETETPVVKIAIDDTNNGNRCTSETAKDDEDNGLQMPDPIPDSTKCINKNMTKKCYKCFEKRHNGTKENIQDAKEDNLTTQNYEKAETVAENSKFKTEEACLCPNGDGALRKVKPATALNASSCMIVHGSYMKTNPSVVEREKQVTPNIETGVPRRPSKEGELPVLTPLEVQTYRNQYGILCFKTTPAGRYVCCPCARATQCEGQNKGNQTEYQTQGVQTVDKNDQSTVTDELRYKSTAAEPDSNIMLCSPFSRNTRQQQTCGDAELPKDATSEQGTCLDSKYIDETNSPTQSPKRDKYASGTISRLSFLFTDMTPPNKSTSPFFDENETPLYSDDGTNFDDTSPMRGNSNCSVGGLKLLRDKQYITNAGSNEKMPVTPSRTPSNNKPSIDNMSKKLNCLSGELALCKELLLREQSREERSHMLTEHPHSTDISLLDEQPSHALRPGHAKIAITEKNVHRCIFTLHIGTAVLSDEAVLSTLGKTLVLRWKFYDQNVSMSHMTTRRVMFFDFSMEYDILMSEEFFTYMKREEMKIVMCELNDQQESFAECALPLRDALLHTNRRVDMSLALVAGQRMIDARNTNNSSDLIDTGDEVGVIDLWCMLRADPKLLPMINRAIARPSVQKKKTDDPWSFSQIRDLGAGSVHKKKQSGETLNGKGKNTSRSVHEGKENQSKTKDEIASHGRETVQVKHEEKRKQQQKRTSKQELNSKASNKEHRDSRDKEIGSQNDDRPEERIFINEVIANIRKPEDMQKVLKENLEQSLHCVSRIPKLEDEILSQTRSSMISYVGPRDKKRKQRQKTNLQAYNFKRQESDYSFLPPLLLPEDTSEKSGVPSRYQNIAKLYGAKLEQAKRQVTIGSKVSSKPSSQNQSQKNSDPEVPQKDGSNQNDRITNYFGEELQITILWLALNEECEAMLNPHVQRVYVAYAFMGKSGADLETPFSLPKPKHYVDKCYFNFKKSFRIGVEDIPHLGHMVRCRAHSKTSKDSRDCIVFSVVSEPPEDPLGKATCEDIGYAYLYFGDLLAYSAGSPTYTEVIPVTSCGSSSICGVLAIKVDGLDILRHCLELTHSGHVPAISKY